MTEKGSRDHFSADPGVLNPILLPLENILEDFNTVLIDTPGTIEGHEADLSLKIKSANSILLLYDMSQENTVDSMKTYWLPFIEKHNPLIPVLIVANKLDVIRTNSNFSLFTRVSKVVRTLMRQFPVFPSNRSKSSSGWRCRRKRTPTSSRCFTSLKVW